MNFDYVIDSYAWVEYGVGSEKGKRIKEIIETKNIATPILAIAELADKFARENKDFSILFNYIRSKSLIISLSMKVALDAGKLKKEMRKKFKQFGLMDAMIYLTAKTTDSILITGDEHFKGMDDVEFIG